MAAPRFVLVGVPRSGTTSFWNYLGQHPQVDVTSMKEINFLAWPGDDVARERFPWMRFRITDERAYRQLFEDGAGRVGVDVSPACFGSPVAVERIRRFAPDAGLLVLLRDPVTRAYSGYLNRVRKGYERRPVEAALVPGERTVDNGFYARRLRQFVDAFGRERLGIWLFDDLEGNTRATMARVFGHLGVDSSVPVDVSAVHNRARVPRRGALARALPGYGIRRRLDDRLPGPARRLARRVWSRTDAPAPALPADVASRLRALYADDIVEVEAITGFDLTAWKPDHWHRKPAR